MTESISSQNKLRGPYFSLACLRIQSFSVILTPTSTFHYGFQWWFWSISWSLMGLNRHNKRQLFSATTADLSQQLLYSLTSPSRLKVNYWCFFTCSLSVHHFFLVLEKLDYFLHLQKLTYFPSRVSKAARTKAQLRI